MRFVAHGAYLQGPVAWKQLGIVYACLVGETADIAFMAWLAECYYSKFQGFACSAVHNADVYICDIGSLGNKHGKKADKK